ncbi:TonB-dependent receptor [Terasakiispira papahanaumokuakeensis]|uniref:TonB-dependent receptor n=2 Tax=Terasakiispira papahanaumokuakeensis TaxID=197479 RepID=A0A1E2VEQ5_9GAMM|nr:TonB-dependent receptor [Terasakiispira papahanaumokuakeensis]
MSKTEESITTSRRRSFIIPLLAGSSTLLSSMAIAADPQTTSAHTDSLSPMVITALRNESDADKTPRRITVIDRAQIQQQLSISQDPGQVLSQLIPSYSPSRQKLSNAGETFRGRDPLYMIDGVPQSNPLRDSSRDSYTIDLDMVERIEVIHGASAEHGLGATGGIINFVTRRAENGTFNQHAGVSVTTDDGVHGEGLGHKLKYRASGQQGSWDYMAGITRQQRGIFYDGDNERIGRAYPGEIQDSTSYDVMGRLGYWLDENQNIELFVNRFELEGDGDYIAVSGDRDAGIPTTAVKGDDLGEPSYNRVTTARLSYRHDQWYGNQVKAQIYQQRFRARFGTTTSFPYFDQNGTTHYDQTRNESDKVGAKFSLTRAGLWENRLTLTTGLDLLQDETQQVLDHTERQYVPETTYQNGAVFLQGSLEATESLTLQAGVRHERAKLDVDTYATIDRSNVRQDKVTVQGGEPDFDETLYNAGLVYQITGWAQAYANYSEGFGMPDVGRVLRGISATGQDVDNLLQLKPIVTDNREVGMRFNWTDYNLEVSYYESDSDYGQRLSEVNGTWIANREKTEIKGIEITGEAKLNDDHQFQASYTHSEGKSDTDGNGRVDTDLTGINIAPDTIKLGWDARWSRHLTSRLQYTHYLDRDIEQDNLDFDGFGLMDASLAYQLPKGQVTLGVENLLDKRYITYYSQAARVSDDYYFTGRGRTWTVGYQLDF